MLTFIPKQAIFDGLTMGVVTCILLLVDLLTKWLTIAKRYNDDKGLEPTTGNIFKAIFFKAWEKGYFESTFLNGMFRRKMYPYATIIFVTVLLQALPDYSLMGVQTDETIMFFLFTFIVGCELFSIIENLKHSGFEHANFLLKTTEQALLKLIKVTPNDKKGNEMTDERHNPDVREHK